MALSIAPEDLARVLARVNALRRLPPGGETDAERAWVESLLDDLFHTSRRLAVYGSLAPGEPNHHVVADLGGSWTDAVVHGDLHETGWGATMGYPAMRWQPDGSEVPVRLFESHALRDAWPRLDAFEGDEYRRVLVPVYEPGGGLTAVANLYEIRIAGDHG